MEKEKFDPVKLFRDIQKDKESSLSDIVCDLYSDVRLKDQIPLYKETSIPFWGSGDDNDIFKTHPEAKKAIPYKPRRKS